jgi:hypothetical protein
MPPDGLAPQYPSPAGPLLQVACEGPSEAFWGSSQGCWPEYSGFGFVTRS